MFSSRFFNDRTSGISRPEFFESDPFFTHNDNYNTNTRVSEEKDYSQYDKEDTPSTSLRTEPQTSTPTPLSTADLSANRRSNRLREEERSSNRLREERSLNRQMRPYQQREDPYEQRLSRWDDFGDFGFGGRSFGGGFGMMDAMMNRMERLLHRVEEDDSLASMPTDGDHSSAYSCSSSSFSQSGVDGQPDISHSSSREVRRIGDVMEESTHFKDSNGNERTTSKRGIAKQMREVITDRNALGQERKVENLRGIQPDEVSQFDQAWNQATEKFDPKHRLLGRGGSTQQQSLPAGTNAPAQIASSVNEKHDIPVSDAKTLPKVDQHQTTPLRTNKKSTTAT